MTKWGFGSVSHASILLNLSESTVSTDPHWNAFHTESNWSGSFELSKMSSEHSKSNSCFPYQTPKNNQYVTLNSFERFQLFIGICTFMPPFWCQSGNDISKNVELFVIKFTFHYLPCFDLVYNVVSCMEWLAWRYELLLGKREVFSMIPLCGSLN